MEHTPGPWSINGNKIDGNGYHIASINSHATTEGRANARLIAAAPDLLEALRDTLDFVERHSNRLDGANGKHPAEVVEYARAAIAKATNA